MTSPADDGPAAGATSPSLLLRAQASDPVAWQRLVQLYGPLNTVVHPEVVQGWLEVVLGFEASSVSRCGCTAAWAGAAGVCAAAPDENAPAAIRTASPATRRIDIARV